MSEFELYFISVKVYNLERARAFYTRLFGEDPVAEEQDRMIEYGFKGIKFGLYNPLADDRTLDESDFGGNCVPAFGVEDVESEFDRVSEFAEIVTHEESGGHEWFTFMDTEGNMLEIYQR